MDLKLAGKIAVVTGASKGIGFAVTRALVEEGAHVVAGARSTKGLEALPGVTAVAVDLSAADGPAHLVGRAIAEHGRLDVLVNNVGAVKLRLDGFLATTDEDFEWAMQMNFFTALRATRAAVTQMLKQDGGAIVSVASVNAFFQPDGGTIDYGAAKAALLNLTKALSQELGPRGIRVNAVSPGIIDTPIRAAMPEEARRDLLARTAAGLPVGRVGVGEDIARQILAFMTIGFATGSIVYIDGGALIT